MIVTYLWDDPHIML